MAISVKKKHREEIIANIILVLPSPDGTALL
jgi:hypothetical protein